MKFSYEAQTPEGNIQSGTVEAASVDAATDILQRYNLIILSIEEEKEGLNFKTEIKFLSRVKKEDIVLFSRQLSVLFDAQVPLLESIKTLAAQTNNPKFKEILASVVEDIDAGTFLSQALSKHPKLFSNFYISVVKAGEASGRLQEVLNYLADHEEKNFELIRKVRGALIYPAFIVFSLVAVAVVLMIFVVPQLSAILEEADATLPILTRIIISISTFLQSFWWLLFIAVIGGLFGLWRYTDTPKGKRILDKLLLQFPILKNLFQKLYLARFAENLSTLIKGGIPIIQALDITGDVVGNTIYQETIIKASEEVRKGGNISSALKENEFIPNLVTQMVTVGERTGKLDVILLKVASFYQKDVDNMVNNMTALIQPILILILGSAAGVLVAAILLPIYNLSSTF